MMKKEFMLKALENAKAAFDAGDVPVGAVIVKDGKIIAQAYNEREMSSRATAHAEVLAIERACEKLGRWRLSDCEMYVTLEPCPMCAGAIVNSRIVSVYYGASDKKAGAFGTLFDMNTMGLNHKPEIIGGVMEKECAGLLSDFFSELRKRKKAEKIAQKAES